MVEADAAAAGVWFTASPVGVGVFDTDARFLYVNDALAELNRLPAADHVGQDPLALFGPVTAEWVALIRQVGSTGHPIPPRRFVNDPVGRHAYEVAYYPVELHGTRRVVALVRDVTADAHAERRAEALSRVASAMSSAVSVPQIAEGMTANVAGLLADRAAFGVVDGDGVRMTALRGYPDELAAQWEGMTLDVSRDTIVGDAVLSREPAVVVGTEAIESRYPRFMARFGRSRHTAVVAVPVLHRDEVVAVIHLAWLEVPRAAPLDIGTARTLGEMAGAAVARVRQAEELERNRFRAALNALFDQVALARAVRGGDGTIVDFELTFVNDRTLDVAGRGPAQLVGRRLRELYPSIDRSGNLARFATVVETGEPFAAEEMPYCGMVDGRRVESWWNLQVVRIDDGVLISSRDVTAAVRARHALEEARAAERSEREAVALLQRFALPLRMPRVPGLRIAAAHHAADVLPPIGGDWYDAFGLDGGRVGLVIGDVAGHGRDAAETMVRIREIVAADSSHVHTPAEALTRASKALFERGPAYVTCLYAIADPADGAVTVASAGHPPPLVHDETGWTVAAQVRPGPPLGVLADSGYHESRLLL
ncbi:MAG TPA: SpoIIE family protein phosphatase, partial [Pseudonocardia sp.]|nr:SpoIIE family protein phosphatase [Pseudonocardia sp.]